MANDVRVDVVTFDAPSSTGNQDITADLGGNTPKLVKFFLNWGSADETTVSTMELGVGAADGTTEFSFSVGSRDNLASTGCGRRAQKTRCIDLSSDPSAALRCFATFVQFLSTTDTGDSTSGVRVNWTDTDATRTPKVTAVFYSGADYEGSIGFITLSGTGDTGTYDPGHVTDLAEFYTPGSTFSAFGTFNIVSQGAASFSGSTVVAERAALSGEESSQASGEQRAQLRDDCVAAQINASTGSISWQASVDISTGTTIRLTTDTGNAAGDEIAVISHNVDGLSVHVGTLTTPTSTGNFSYTSPGFEPQWAMLLPTMVRTINTVESTDQGGVGGHIALGVDSDSCVAGSVEWASDPTNTNSVWADKAIYVLEDDGTVEFNGTKTGFQTDGIDFNLTATNGTARLWGVACIETATAETTLIVADASHTQTSDIATFVQQNTLTVSDADHAQVADATSFVQQNMLSVSDTSHAQLADNITLDVAANLVVQDASHTQISDEASFVQQSVLSIADAVHAQSADNTTLDVALTLSVNDASHAQLADEASFVQQNILALDDAAHAHQADNITLVSAGVLDVQDATHAQSADSTSFVQQNILVTDDALHGQTADNAGFTVAGVLSPNDATHTQSADNVDLVQQHVLVIADASHGQSADNATLDTFTQLLVDDAGHVQFADSADFVQQNVLAVNNAAHGQSAENVSLAEQQTLDPDDAQHAQASDNATLGLEAVLLIDDASHGHISVSTSFVQQHILDVVAASHAQTAQNADLSVEFTLLLDDCLHGHTASEAMFSLGVPILTGLGERLMVINPETRLMIVRD